MALAGGQISLFVSQIGARLHRNKFSLRCVKSLNTGISRTSVSFANPVIIGKSLLIECMKILLRGNRVLSCNPGVWTFG